MSSDIDDLWEKLKAQRDEMRVQAHLARAEFRDEWEELEEKWQKAERKLERIQDQAVETVRNSGKRQVRIRARQVSAAVPGIGKTTGGRQLLSRLWYFITCLKAVPTGSPGIWTRKNW